MDLTIIGIIGIGLVQVWTVRKLTQLWLHTTSRNKHDKKTHRLLLAIVDKHSNMIEHLGKTVNDKNLHSES